MSTDDRMPTGGKKVSPGPFLARVVSHADPTYMGGLQVQLEHETGNNKASTTELHPVKYMSPFAGQTSVDFIGKEPDDYDNTQKAYGMWMVPPDVGTTVVVIFIDGDPKKGYWIGCVPDRRMNFSVPGHAATQFAVEDSKSTDKTRVPVAEYNKIAQATTADPTVIPKPASPLEQVFDTQGLLEDDIRGITTSSARRETPSAVFGISTPGPIDKVGKKAKIGKEEYLIGEGAYVSRLGGSTFVMDDGDDKYIRKTPASDGPPDYEALEQLNEGETPTGDQSLPHNELIRIRTRTGHQILLHNSEDLIYIGNARGTSWIELSSDGKIDVYAEDSVSLHTKQDLNFYADRDINIEAGRNLNIKVAEEMHTNVLADHILIVDGNQKIHIKQDVDKTYDQNYKHHVKQKVDKLYESDFLHTVYNSVVENFVTQGGTVKTTTGGSTDVIINGDIKITHNGSFDHTVTGDRKVTTGGTHHINSSGQHIETASQIHMNGPTAATAAAAAGGDDAEAAVLPEVLKTHSVPDEEGSELTQSIMRRIPTHEPWPHHENLDPAKFKPDQTDRDAEGRTEDNTDTMNFTPDYWKAYTTITDTFAKIKAAGEEPEE